MVAAMCSPSTTPCTFPSVPLLTRLAVFARFSVEAYYGTPSTRNLNPSPWLAIYFILICEPYRVKIGPFRSPSLAEVPLLRRLPMAQFSLLSRLPPLSEIHRVLQSRVNIRCGDRESWFFLGSEFSSCLQSIRSCCL